MLKRLSALLAILALTACGTQATMATMPPSAQTIKHISERSYQVGARKTATVGESIIKVKDFFIEQIERPVFSPTQDFTLTRKLADDLKFVKGAKYPAYAQIEFQGERHYAVINVVGSPLLALVKTDGKVNQRVAVLMGAKVVIAGFDHTLSPEGAMMTFDKRGSVLSDRPYVNHEILYSGSSAGSLNFVYREFSKDDLTTTTFSQPLTYDAKNGLIRYKNYRIQIYSVSNNGIEYAVLDSE